ncbi:hypothetical protein [Desulforhabdus amnigena]|uniref:Lipoprotein n=1 Tax=Desulforhabdus amnigena TaxID=40218 RepID=A0A9W6FVV1_9BACT|nr:hypothetical protein [Desulforhabdus amnigena]NLJ27042.1 hypothetical protein [Deltaproteobacteria bacterium]GLI35778.1 hypothetical protein DAMNIGENAA_32110 [Desulforhabdus amnigena]
MPAFQKEWIASRVALVLAAIVLIMMLFACTSSSESRTEGFRGMKWGSALKDPSQFEPLAEEGDLKFYRKKGEDLKVEDVKVENIVYGFYKNRFYNVMVYYASPENFQRLKEILSRWYGNPVEPEQGVKKYFWNVDLLNVLLDYNDAAGSGRISYFFRPIQTEIEVSR